MVLRIRNGSGAAVPSGLPELVGGARLVLARPIAGMRPVLRRRLPDRVPLAQRI